MDGIVPAPWAALFADHAALRLERAVSELRAGRPVLVRDASTRGTSVGEGTALAVLPLDSATPDAHLAFARATGGEASLVVTAPRAVVLGLDAPRGAAFPLKGLGWAEAREVAFGSGPAPRPWRHASSAEAGCCELAKRALLLPAVAVARVAEDAPAFAQALSLDLRDLDAPAVPPRFRIVSRAPVPLAGLGDAEFVVFRGGSALRDQVAVIIGRPDPDEPVPVRIHSACLTGDLLGSLRCDCGDQLQRGTALLAGAGGGVLLYLDQEGRGTGIAAKMRAYALQDGGLDTVDADAALGYGIDERRYEAACAMLDLLGYRRVDLLTNNPDKIAFLESGGIQVVRRSALLGEVTDGNRRYLEAKARRAGHLLPLAGEPSF